MAGEKPAARVTDMHTCPETDGPVPHVGGPIIMGSLNVFIGGLPAARVTDPVTCVGPPDTIVMGSPTVVINGMMAARMGDQTAHGGIIVGGCPTVLIGMGGAGASPVSMPNDPPIVPLLGPKTILELAFAAFGGELLDLGGFMTKLADMGGDTSVLDIVAPGGEPVGEVANGATSEIRTVEPKQFGEIKNRLQKLPAQKIAKPGYGKPVPGDMYQIPDGSTFGFRNSPASGDTIDINHPALPKGFKIHQK